MADDDQNTAPVQQAPDQQMPPVAPQRQLNNPMMIMQAPQPYTPRGILSPEQNKAALPQLQRMALSNVYARQRLAEEEDDPKKKALTNVLNILGNTISVLKPLKGAGQGLMEVAKGMSDDKKRRQNYLDDQMKGIHESAKYFVGEDPKLSEDAAKIANRAQEHGNAAILKQQQIDNQLKLGQRKQLGVDALNKIREEEHLRRAAADTVRDRHYQSGDASRVMEAGAAQSRAGSYAQDVGNRNQHMQRSDATQGFRAQTDAARAGTYATDVAQRGQQYTNKERLAAARASSDELDKTEDMALKVLQAQHAPLAAKAMKGPLSPDEQAAFDAGLKGINDFSSGSYARRTAKYQDLRALEAVVDQENQPAPPIGMHAPPAGSLTGVPPAHTQAPANHLTAPPPAVAPTPNQIQATQPPAQHGQPMRPPPPPALVQSVAQRARELWQRNPHLSADPRFYTAEANRQLKAEAAKAKMAALGGP